MDDFGILGNGRVSLTCRLGSSRLHNLDYSPIMPTERDALEALGETHETLRQLQKSESISQLSRGIGHEFNNLMQGIVGSLELVRKLLASGRGEETGKFIDRAINSAQRASALNERLLTFSRRQPPAPQALSMNELIVGMGDILRSSLTHSSKLDLNLSEDLWLTRCDANQAEGAVLNLVLNARDAMPGGGTVTIQTRNLEVESAEATQPDIAPGSYVCVTVKDTGAGMTPEIAEHAFDPFFTTKAAGHGAGLGLTMARRFARTSGGGARIVSETGRGTSVALYLPRYQTQI